MRTKISLIKLLLWLLMWANICPHATAAEPRRPRGVESQIEMLLDAKLNQQSIKAAGHAFDIGDAFYREMREVLENYKMKRTEDLLSEAYLLRDTAYKYYKESLDIASTQAGLEKLMGDCYMQIGKLKEETKGERYRAKDNYEAAWALYKKIDAQGDQAEASRHIGLRLYMIDDTESRQEALSYFERAIKEAVDAKADQEALQAIEDAIRCAEALGLSDRIEEYQKTQRELRTAKGTRRINVYLSVLLLVVVIAAFVLGGLLLVIYRNSKIIAKEKAKSERLLLSILPEEAAEELKETGQVTPRQYDDVTILFTDFKGFTSLSEKLTPQQLVEELDMFFTKFDEISDRYRLERIKTIGDAYMAAGGLPEPNFSHPGDAVAAGLEMQQFVEERKKEKQAKGDVFFELRCGINTGTVVAGVVGKKKFAYDIWGDAVNLASRMESSAEIGKVNISASTYERIKTQFDCTYRGKMPAKNKGDVKMYSVNRETKAVPMVDLQIE